jgi:hypothetical protein
MPAALALGAAAFLLAVPQRGPFSAPAQADAMEKPLSLKSWLDEFYQRAPHAGVIDNKLFQHIPIVDLGKKGKSESPPIALRIRVADDVDTKAFPGGIGKIVKERNFPKSEYPHGFTFNVSFGCAGGVGLKRISEYSDPESIWYNVFFGYYEIDVKKSEWGRPFGYQWKKGAQGRTYNDVEIHVDDIIRIGKSDWNHFSNQLYGVPDKYIAPLETQEAMEKAITKAKKEYKPADRVPIGGGAWDVVGMSEVEVVGSFPGMEKFEDLDPFVGTGWRLVFGEPDPSKLKTLAQKHKPFAPTLMSGKFYMSYVEDKDSYRTFMFGGTINNAFDGEKNPTNQEFLELQLKELRSVIENEKDLGFGNKAPSKKCPFGCAIL